MRKSRICKPSIFIVYSQMDQLSPVGQHHRDVPSDPTHTHTHTYESVWHTACMHKCFCEYMISDLLLHRADRVLQAVQDHHWLL